mgnify:CR=1 FL=1
MQVDITSALLLGFNNGAPLIAMLQVSVLEALSLGFLGALLGYLAGGTVSKIRAAAAEISAGKIIENANREAEVIRKDASVEAKDTVIRARELFEEQNNSKRKELRALEDRSNTRETNLERKVSMLEKKEESIDSRIAEAEDNKLSLIHISATKRRYAN